MHEKDTMDNDDLPIGRVLSRREAIQLFAASGAVLLAGCKGGVPRSAAAANRAASNGLPGCVVRPELTMGPYFVDKRLDRSDIRGDPSTGAIKPGVPLTVAFNVSQVGGGTCAPLPGAMVDVWQCDAAGEYSAVNDRMVGFDTTGQSWLRGYQMTDANGVARFVTIYPGWYPGRTVHIHFKIRKETAPNETYDFTSQLFFDDDLTDRVHTQPPYAARGQRDRRNSSDGIFRQAGDQLQLALAQTGDGFEARFDVGLDLSDAETGRPDRMRRG